MTKPSHAVASGRRLKTGHRRHLKELAPAAGRGRRRLGSPGWSLHMGDGVIHLHGLRTGRERLPHDRAHTPSRSGGPAHALGARNTRASAALAHAAPARPATPRCRNWGSADPACDAVARTHAPIPEAVGGHRQIRPRASPCRSYGEQSERQSRVKTIDVPSEPRNARCAVRRHTACGNCGRRW